MRSWRDLDTIIVNMNTFLLILVIALFSIALFLLRELIKKFWFWESFRKSSKQQFSWKYNGDKNPGMYILEIVSREPLQAVVGFEFSFWPIKNAWYDVFWYIETKEGNRILVSLYLWRGPVELIFLCTSEVSEVSVGTYSGDETPHYEFLPHWWQKIGIFG